jgi:hypothetical protein
MAKQPAGPPMTLGNMRALGVQRRVAYYPNDRPRVSRATARALHHWAIDRPVSDPLLSAFLWVSVAEDSVIHDLSGASLPDGWCIGHLLKLQASRRHAFGRQAKRLVL